MLARAMVVIVLTGASGAGAGLAWGQSTEEQADKVCAADCTARGYEAEYCARVCEQPDASRPPLPATDLRCARACRDRGGDSRDCLQRCPMR